MTETFNSAEEAIVYFTECTLATVESMSMKKKPPVGELNRQIAIAQQGVTFIKNNRINTVSRIKEVICNFKSDVALWATDQSL